MSLMRILSPTQFLKIKFRCICCRCPRAYVHLSTRRIPFIGHIHRGCSSTSSSVPKVLPESIEKQCQEWEIVLQAEKQQRNGRQTWFGLPLKVTKVLADLKTPILILTTANMSREQIFGFQRSFRVGTPVELKERAEIGKDRKFFGTINRFNRGISSLLHVHIKLHNDIRENLSARGITQNSRFDIRISDQRHFNQLIDFVKSRLTYWPAMPGYELMLYAFAHKQLPKNGGREEQQRRQEIISLEDMAKGLDTSQMAALAAALNPDRPIVAVQGPPGSGKTRLLAEFLRILSLKKNSNVIVITSSTPSLYNLLNEYCTLNGQENFICFHKFSKNMAEKTISEQSIREIIERSTKSLDERPINFWESESQTTADKDDNAANEEKSDFEKIEVMKEGEEKTRGPTIDAGILSLKDYIRSSIEQKNILFMTFSQSTLNMFQRYGITFDFVLIENAEHLSEFRSWRTILPLSNRVRLFGDYFQPESTMVSDVGQQLEFTRSLLQRLDEQFGPEINFHLSRQYRSHPIIQAWSNRVFYGKRAAEAVNHHSLEDLLPPAAVDNALRTRSNLITDPLVMVNTTLLEGEWTPKMFSQQRAGKSFYIFGNLLLSAAYLRMLIMNGIDPTRIVCFTPLKAEHINLKRTFLYLYPEYRDEFTQVHITPSQRFLGKQADVVVKMKPYTNAVGHTPRQNLHHLQHNNLEITRARRQFVLITDSRSLEGLPEMLLLLDVFRTQGRILGPNDLFPLLPGQFEQIKYGIEQKYQRKRAMQLAEEMDKLSVEEEPDDFYA